MARRFATTVILLSLILALTDPVHGLEKRIKIRTVVVMPFGTFSVEGVSVDMTRVVSDVLTKSQLKILADGALEKFLVDRRIRRADFLDRSAIREMGTILEADVLMMGSAHLLSADNNPQVTVSAQIISCLDASVVWANFVSLTGADSTTFLGLGKTTSLKKLVDIAVHELLKDFPNTMAVGSSAISPFEIVIAGFFPDVLRGGETSLLSIELREITEKVRDVRAFLDYGSQVLGDEIDLKTEDGKRYSGTVTAPTIDGVYPLKIEVLDQRDKTFSMDAVASLTVQNSPPQVALLLRQNILSPNNDGINDHVLFVPEVLAPISLKSWRVEIANESGQIVRSEEGMALLPEGFVWRGEDDQYAIVRDGTYLCRLVVEDTAGNRTATATDSIIVDTRAPEVTVTIVEQSENDVSLALKADDANEIESWELVVYDEAGAKLTTFDGRGDIPETLTYVINKENQAKLEEKQQGLFSYSLSVSDIAGNRLEVEKQPLKQREAERREHDRPSQKKVWIEDF